MLLGVKPVYLWAIPAACHHTYDAFFSHHWGNERSVSDNGYNDTGNRYLLNSELSTVRTFRQVNTFQTKSCLQSKKCWSYKVRRVFLGFFCVKKEEEWPTYFWPRLSTANHTSCHVLSPGGWHPPTSPCLISLFSPGLSASIFSQMCCDNW